jgi:nitroreductase
MQCSAQKPQSALDAIMARRSVREFTQEPVDASRRRVILEAAMAAPSAHGKKPWRFAIIDQKEMLERVVAVFPWFRPALCADFTVLVAGFPDACEQREYWTVDCAAATENILIAARALDLGSVWMGIAPVEDNIRKFLTIIDLPQGIVPFSLVAMGRPADPAAQTSRREAWSEQLLVDIKLKVSP